MEISAVEDDGDVDSAPSEHVDSSRAPRAPSVPPNPTTDSTEARIQRMEQMMLAMLQKGSTNTRSNQQSSHGKVSGLKPGEIDRLMKEGRCFRCKEKGHMKHECTKQQLKW
jgi:hypothetical protein